MQDPLSEPMISHLAKSHNYVLCLIAKTCQKIQGSLFYPKMYVATKNVQLFTLYPIYLLQQQFIEIDEQILRLLVKHMGEKVGTGMNVF